MNWAKVALFAGGALFGSAGIEILCSLSKRISMPIFSAVKEE